MHRIVGLDWASDALRAAVLETSFRGFAVKEVRTALLPPEGTPAERLRAALDGMGLVPPIGGDDSVAVALPGAQAASHVITLPFTDQKRIDQVLPSEVEGVTPFDIADVVWDYAVLGEHDGKTEVLVCVVKKTVLRELLDTLIAAGVEPRVVTFAPLALSALGERGLLGIAVPEAGTPAPAFAIIDGGPDRANLTLLVDNKPVLARAIASANAAVWAAASVDEAARSKLFTTLARDLKISLRSRPARPTRVLIAGALAQIPGAAEWMANEFQLPVESAPTPDTALAMGLALRAQQPRGRINFRRGEFSFTKDLSQVRGQLGKLALAGATLLILALALGMARLSSLHKQIAAYDDAVCSATKRILGTCTTDYRQAIGQLSGRDSKAAGIPRVSAAEIFAEVMAQFPEAAFPVLEDVEVTTTIVRVKGVAESFGAVGVLQAALKKDKCLGEVKQPRVEKQPGGSKVTFTLEFPYLCSGEKSGGA